MNMKMVEIKGFWGFISFACMGLLMLGVAVVLPVSFIWVAWNAFVGEMFHGPMIAFWQAMILTASIAVSLIIIFQRQVSFQIKRVKSPEELEKYLGPNRQDSPKD